MRFKLPAIVALLASIAAPAAAVELADSAFQVTYQYAGDNEVLNDTVVPLLPNNACYSWHAQLGAGPTPASATETLSLPVALADWGTLATDPNDGIEISADGKVAVRTFTPEIDAEGWFSQSWCVAPGDPTGAHSIAIAIDGKALATYEFQVVLPEDYYWPTILQPEPRERSVDHSW